MQCLLLLSLLALPTPPALANEIDDALKGIPAQLDALKADQFQKVAQHAKAYQASATLFGQTATVFLYWPDAKKLNEPVIAAVLPNQFTADKLLGIGSALDIGLNKPAVFWMKNEGTLDRKGMPADLQKHMAGAGMPGAVQADQGFNLFGQLATGFVGDVLKAAPINLNANNLFAGAAKGKGGYAVSLSIGANTAWNNPFGLADTKIKGGTVRVTSKDKTKTVEAWGTATLKPNKDYTVYMQKEAGDPGQTIGFDLKSASLADYFVVLGVVGKTLGLPAFPVPSKLRLDMVTLENPAYQAYTDASAPLNFDSMMFKGKLVKSADGELITNARGKVFGQPVASINLKASKEGVKGAADVNVGLGELKAASAKFYLDVAMTGTPAMGIKAETVLGSLDLKASSKGLELDVPAQCPLRPVGFTATLTDLALNDFPIKPNLKDCFSEELGKLANGVVADAEEALKFGEDLAMGAADTAGELGKGALETADKLGLERVAAWGPSLVSHALEVRSAKDVLNNAGKAVSAAEKTVSDLANKITQLDKEIENLAKEIKNLLEDIWGAITDTIKSKKKQKSNKESARDFTRTVKAATERGLAHAKALQSDARQGLQEIPGPNVVGTVADKQQEWLGARAQVEVQAHVAEVARRLAGDLRKPDQLKSLVAGVDQQAFVAEREAAFAAEYKTLAAALKPTNGRRPLEHFLENSRKVLLAEAITKRLEQEAESKLRSTVSGLPSMAFDKALRMVDASGRCLQQDSAGLSLSACARKPEQGFRFQKGGVVHASNMKKDEVILKFFSRTIKVKTPGASEQRCFSMETRPQKFAPGSSPPLRLASGPCTPNEIVHFFFDPADGLIRYLPENAEEPWCLRTRGNNVVGAVCPKPGEALAEARWSLLPLDQMQAAAAPTKAPMKAMSSGSTTMSAARQKQAAPVVETNLDPLSLD